MIMEEEKSAWSTSVMIHPVSRGCSSSSEMSEETEDDDIVQAAELLVQLSDENSNNNGGGGGDEEEDDGARQVSFPNKVAEVDNAVPRRRRRRPKFRSIVEIYAQTKPMENGQIDDVVSVFGSWKKKRC